MNESEPGPEPTKFLLRPKTFERVNPPSSDESTKPIQVHQILQDNLKVNEGVAPLVLDLSKRTSRRKRDYLILLAFGNAGILLIMSLLPDGRLFLVLGMSSIATYSLILTWLMFGVMDNY